MKSGAVRTSPTTFAMALVWAWMVVGTGGANGQIVGYSPSQPSPLNPTGPNVYDPRFDRFTTSFGKPSNPNNEPPLANVPPAPNAAQFVAAGYDLSGVGWLTSNPGFSFAMISPRDFITAVHNGGGTFTAGTQVTFFTGNASASTTVTATVAGSRAVASLPGSPFGVSDILLGTLTADVPGGVTSYAIPVGVKPTQYTGATAYPYDQSHRVGTNTVSGFFDNQNVNGSDSTNLVGYAFDPNATGQLLYQGGDSGKPTFMKVGSQLALLGSHSAVGSVNGTQFSFDAFLPDYVPQINTAMTLAGSPYQVRVVPVPEPTLALAAAAVGAGTWTGWRRFRRRGNREEDRRRAGAA